MLPNPIFTKGSGRLSLAAIALSSVMSCAAVSAQQAPQLLTDPFLQLPTASSVNVVWFTEFEGQSHLVTLEDGRIFKASTTKLSRMAEDKSSHVGTQNGDGSLYKDYTLRDIWRHEAVVDGLTAGQRVAYSVESLDDAGAKVASDSYSLAADPADGQSLKILLTSDHQLKPMTPANMQLVEKNFGIFDAVLYAGDLQNVPDQASGWFDDNRGGAFFPALQGRATLALKRERTEGDSKIETETIWRGGHVIQNAPFFPIVGNHEVMGRFNMGDTTGTQFNDPVPRAVAEKLYAANAELYNPTGNEQVKEQWIRDNSFNTLSYEELFTLPDNSPGGETYWAKRFGDVYVIGLYGTRIWRSPSTAPTTRGKYREAEQYLNKPDEWGWGEFIFEDMNKGSKQYEWLKDVLASDSFKSAPYKIVMMHNPSHGLGDNSIPVYAQPVQYLDRNEAGNLTMVRYEYPIANDQYVRDVEPLLEEAGVQLMLNGHSHLWNRFVTEKGLNILETSNVGNSYGCYLEGYKARDNGPVGAYENLYNMADYPTQGDPHGLTAVMPTEFAPMKNEAGEDLPCIASNELSSFSVLETDKQGATISSYVFNSANPDAGITLFDKFDLK